MSCHLPFPLFVSDPLSTPQLFSFPRDWWSELLQGTRQNSLSCLVSFETMKALIIHAVSFWKGTIAETMDSM